MRTEIPTRDAHQEMRAALRAMCRSFDSACWHKVDNDRGYLEAFVDALTEAGWMAGLIPAEYGGSGPGLAEASVTVEEVNFSGGKCRGIARPDVQHGHGAAARLGPAEAAVPAGHRQRQAAPAVDGGREWKVFCDKVLMQPALAADLRFDANTRRNANRSALKEIILAAFGALSAEEVIARLEAAQSANAHVNTVGDMWSHPQLRARGRFREVDTPNGHLPCWRPASTAVSATGWTRFARSANTRGRSCASWGAVPRTSRRCSRRGHLSRGVRGTGRPVR